MPSRIPTPRAAAGPFRAADWPNTMRSSKTPGSARVGSAPSRLRRMSAADVAVAFRRETGMDSPRAVWFQQFGSNSMLKVPPAQQFYWGNRAVPSLARVAERGGHHGAPPADEASSPSTRALIDRIGDPSHAAIEFSAMRNVALLGRFQPCACKQGACGISDHGTAITSEDLGDQADAKELRSLRTTSRS